jgi:hypothetical protein
LEHRSLGGGSAAVLGAVFLCGAPAARADAISACVNKSSGSVRIVGSAGDCGRPELFLQWNKDGSLGPKGFDGKDGRDGRDGRNGHDGKDGHDGQDGSSGISVLPLPVGNEQCPAGGVELIIAASGGDHGDGADHHDRGNASRVAGRTGNQGGNESHGCGDGGRDKRPAAPSSWNSRLQAGLNRLRTSLLGATSVEGDDGDDDGSQCPAPKTFFICNGKDGAAGSPGPAGSQGPAGPVGPQGPAGTNGQGVTVAMVTVNPDGPCPNGGIKVTSASGVNYVCNGLNGLNGTGGGADVDDTAYETPTPTVSLLQTSALTKVASLVPLPKGVWTLVGKAQANGGSATDCFLMPHSDIAGTLPGDTSPALDETTVNPSAGPVALVLTGLLDTMTNNDGADLLCASTGAVAFSHAKIVAHQASELHDVGSTGP